MKITEELLKELGFKQEPPFWDYYHGKGKPFLRFYKAGTSGAKWTMSYRGGLSQVVGTFMDAVVLLTFIARGEGVQEAQDQFQQALGLDRLLDKAMERFRQEMS